MDREKFWCIHDLRDHLRQTYAHDCPYLSDTGTGLSWSRKWRDDLAGTFSAERRRATCPELGLEVWFYPEESRPAFLTWLAEYVERKKHAREFHKSQSPVLPRSGYEKGTRFEGKKAYFTGFYPADKKTITDVIVPQTGIIAEESFKKTTEFLIMGPNRGPSKTAKAAAIGIPCVSVEIFIDEVIGSAFSSPDRSIS